MPPLDIARLALLVAHFIGLAALIGPFLLQIRGGSPLRLRLMLIGAVVQVVTGNALIASRRLQGIEVDELKMILKLGIAVATLGLLIAAVIVQRRRGADAGAVRPLFFTAGGFALADVVVAVVWS
ncbi:hypothetical protein [Brachybacterium sp. FME24]|uniref:hypothetical protein n=1 Tax=Brachybacterium sp. FME24 TaxID=2742605 RepID=UPI001867433D|nr:hypothetical protein [Brachybacterium sp. FME24]